MSRPAAILALADGTVLRGISVGAAVRRSGELVFNTAMSGYQEILSDPSYARQIINFSCPHIGNVGVNPEDLQSDGVHAAGVVLRDLSPRIAGHRGRSSLSDFLISQGVPGIAGLDTRRLVRRLRDEGALHACIDAGERPDAEQAVREARAFPGLSGMDLARVYSCDAPYAWEEGKWEEGKWEEGKREEGKREEGKREEGKWEEGKRKEGKREEGEREEGEKKNSDGGFFAGSASPHSPHCRVAVMDFGVKRDILRCLVAGGAEVQVFPATTGVEQILAQRPDGILLSNGPGDPQPCDYAIDTIRMLQREEIPLFGICLGFQLLALACGARTCKMKFGHHGANHPIRDLDSGRVWVSSQNHGFMVEEDTLPDELRATHHSLFDGSLQGFHHRSLPFFGVQGHPEAAPGPQETSALFDHFFALIKAFRDRVGRDSSGRDDAQTH